MLVLGLGQWSHFFILKRFLKLYICIYACMCLSVHMLAGAHRGKKKVLDTLDLELQATVNCLTWVFKTKLGSL